MSDHDYHSSTKEELIAELKRLGNINKKLEDTFRETNNRLQSLEFNLRERRKELDYHIQLSKIFTNPGYSIDEILEKVVELIPLAWCFPETTGALIIVNHKSYSTPGYSASAPCLEKQIMLDQGILVKVIVSNTTPIPFDNSRYFLEEEEILLDSIARRIHLVSDTDRKKTVLTQTSQKFQNLLENISDVIYEIDIEGVITYIGPSVFRISGYTPEELTGAAFLNFIYEPDRQKLIENYLLLEKNKFSSQEFRVVTKEGNLVWMRSASSAVLKDAVFMGSAGSLTNIHEQKQYEVELRKSESLYRSIIAASPDVITITELDGTIVFTSPRAVDMFGFGQDDVLTGHNMLEYIHPSDHERAMNGITEMFRGNMLGADEYKGIRKDGSIFDIEVNGEFIRGVDGQAIQMIFVTRDITFRKQTVEALKRTEALFKKMVESINDVIYEVASDGTINYVSPAVETILGYSSQELIGRSFFAFMYEDDRPMLTRALSELGSKDFSYLEYRYYTRDGKIRWVRSSTTPIVENGMLIGGRGSLNDIHDRKLAEAALIESEQKYKALFFDSPEGYLIMRDGLFIECNKAAEVMLTGNRTMILGRSPADLSLEYQPNGWKSGEYLEILLSDLKILGKSTFEWVFTRFNGTELSVRINFTLIDYDLDKAIFVSCHDITEQREGEEKLRKLSMAVEQSPVSIVITNLDGNIEYANPRACETTGYSFDELIGKNPRVLKSGETQAKEYDYLWENITNGKEWRGIFHNKRKNGELYWESSTISPIFGVTGKISHFIAVKEDITKQKAAEEELVKFRTISEKANYGNAIADLDGNLIYCNDAFAKMHGYEVHEMLNRHLSMLHNEIQMVRVVETLEILKTQGEFMAEEVWCTRKDGSIFPSLMNAKMIVNSNNQPQFLSATAIDITEIKASERALRESEERLNNAQELAQMGSWDFNVITGEVRWSQNYYRLLEVPVTEKPYSLDRVKQLVHPEDRHLLGLKIEEMKDSKALESIYFRLVFPGDRIKWIQSNMVPRFDSDKLVSLSGVSIDITKKKIQEDTINKLSLAVKQSPVSIVITDLNANIEYVNPAFLENTGYRLQEVIGQNTRILKSDHTPLETYKNLWDTITSDKNWHGEWVNRKKNGELYWESISITPIHNDSGVTTNYLAIKQDITERKRAEDKILDLNLNLEKKIVERTADLEKSNADLIKARIDAEEANLAKSEFLSRMSHELRTPMNSILGFAQLLEMGGLNPGQKKGVNHIMKSGKHLLDLINEVLDIARIEAGKISLSLEPVQTMAVIQEMLDVVGPLINEKRIKIELGSGDQAMFIKADRQRLKQVLLNLINNAVKYNVDGGSIFIKTELKTSEASPLPLVRLSVTDTGKGISLEDQAKLFNPFERIGAEKTGLEGTGLGLAVAKKLVEAMNGRIGVESKPGFGATFWIELPHVESQLESVLKSSAWNENQPAHHVKSGLILYIEDNASNVELVQQILTSLRPEINLITTTQGKEAFTMASAYNPDLILLDLNLPDIHGSEVIEQIMKDPVTKEIPVVIVSADAMPHQIRRLLDLGAKGYLTKPLDVTDFVGIIDDYIACK
jgi:PAS domain S-box-containing protein